MTHFEQNFPMYHINDTKFMSPYNLLYHNDHIKNNDFFSLISLYLKILNKKKVKKSFLNHKMLKYKNDHIDKLKIIKSKINDKHLKCNMSDICGDKFAQKSMSFYDNHICVTISPNVLIKGFRFDKTLIDNLQYFAIFIGNVPVFNCSKSDLELLNLINSNSIFTPFVINCINSFSKLDIIISYDHIKLKKYLTYTSFQIIESHEFVSNTSETDFFNIDSFNNFTGTNVDFTDIVIQQFNDICTFNMVANESYYIKHYITKKIIIHNDYNYKTCNLKINNVTYEIKPLDKLFFDVTHDLTIVALDKHVKMTKIMLNYLTYCNKITTSYFIHEQCNIPIVYPHCFNKIYNSDKTNKYKMFVNINDHVYISNKRTMTSIMSTNDNNKYRKMLSIRGKKALNKICKLGLSNSQIKNLHYMSFHNDLQYQIRIMNTYYNVNNKYIERTMIKCGAGFSTSANSGKTTIVSNEQVIDVTIGTTTNAKNSTTFLPKKENDDNDDNEYEIIFMPTVNIPKMNGIYGYKACASNENNMIINIIVKLFIPEHAKISKYVKENKIRTNEATVVAMYKIIDNIPYPIYPDSTIVVFSLHDNTFQYKYGQTINPANGFSESLSEVCAPGIHFFVIPENALAYGNVNCNDINKLKNNIIEC